MFKRRQLNRLIYSFPIQLLVVLFKRNLVLLLYWVILFGFITGGILEKFGTPFLFLNPEYRSHVGFTSFFIMGFAVGSFVMVFNVSSYIVNGYRFPFIATLSRPFLKYAINNFIVPVGFILLLLYKIIDFQLYNEYAGIGSILVNVSGFLIGLFLICFFTLTYFFRTNKDIIIMFGVEASDADPQSPIASHLDISNPRHTEKHVALIRLRRKWRVDTYLAGITRVKLVRKTDHYKREMLESVFRQNHLNATLVEIIVFAGFIIMGLFKDHEYFKIPAGASVILLFSMLIMISSAFRFWMKTWTTSVFILLLLILNFLSGMGVFYSHNKAFGLKYSGYKSTYSLAELNKAVDAKKIWNDSSQTIRILEKWKAKNSRDGMKPRIVVFCTSGGGSRASMFTFRVMQVADRITDGNFMHSVQLISGASGGLIGACYYRELFLENQEGKLPDYNNDTLLYNTAKDLLNPVWFSITVSDLFMNVQRFEQNGERYLKDRGYSFEKQLNENLGSAFSKPLSHYTLPEQNATVPMVVSSPSIVNDGRRLIISSQPVSYLVKAIPKDGFDFMPANDAIEFTDFFEKQNASNTQFSSIMRMNSTFPYILPAVSLPSEPIIKVMDAGLRDNFGTKNALRFLYVFRKWIQENTSGVVFIQVRDVHKFKPIDKSDKSLFEHVVSPIGNVYGNLLTIQDYNEDESISYASSWLNMPFDYISFELPTYEEEISLSWHLTTREKKSIYNAAYLQENKVKFEKLKNLLSNKKEAVASFR